MGREKHTAGVSLKDAPLGLSLCLLQTQEPGGFNNGPCQDRCTASVTSQALPCDPSDVLRYTNPASTRSWCRWGVTHPSSSPQALHLKPAGEREDAFDGSGRPSLWCQVRLALTPSCLKLPRSAEGKELVLLERKPLLDLEELPTPTPPATPGPSYLVSL